MKIWQRSIFSQLAKTFSFFFFCFLVIYMVVDLSVHGVRFLSKSSLIDVLHFYMYTFASLLELFLTLAFLMAALRVLFDLNAHREFTALQMAGISKKRLLSPFFLFAGILSSLVFINSEWVAPAAQEAIDTFKETHKGKKRKEEHVYSISLKDHSELVYQNFDRGKKELFDVFWIRTPSDIWHMKHLQLEPLCGRFVTHFVRNEKNQMEKEASFERKKLPELLWDEKAILNRWTPIENRSISTLFTQAWIASSEQSSVHSHLFHKLLAPLVPFLILFAISPACMVFSRQNRPFFIAVCSIFGLIALKVVLDGMLVLGENQVLTPSLALIGPILLVLCLSTPSFLRMR